MVDTYEYLDSTPAEQARLAAVRRYQLVDRPAEAAYDRIAYIAATIVDTPIASVTMVEEDRVWLAACYGLAVREIGIEPGLCASAIGQDGIYVVRNAAKDPRTVEHPLVTGELKLRFYAAAPIRTRDGFRLGTVNVIDRKPRDPEQKHLRSLEYLAEIVADELELRLMAIRGSLR
ncbi:sigma-B regulation protein RsbU (phosphoserine phosphatase) [Catenuloplanes nepalensis]|uniref:Sigma-B regulation protein RsbU (Phosphoserine phosphatase) n=1 Tax=Catenuloplanes nepalensis TaxID=587533 RepID=A0ABT9MXE4_9ACTN|nr:GAF domain-containing protein [Catenuloplanes nepalensis]MDP9795916.1 sigma-B regulation protein RsbU (phosphoserine phosphatase) [Catenuloplanes nepalensis]